MIKHVYLYKLKNREDAEMVCEHLKNMTDYIESICGIEIGMDFTNSEKSYDLIQMVSFMTIDDFNAFTAHPYHEEMRVFLKSYVEAGYKVDYQINQEKYGDIRENVGD